MKKLLFVFNPYSGTGVIREHLSEVLNVFTKAGYAVVAYPTQCAGDGINKIHEIGAQFDRIVVAGGDGMLNEMVNGVMSLPKEVETGYIPTGTVNDFASTHGIPKHVVEAAEIAVSDNVKSLDLGKFGDKYFAYVSAFGFATDVPYKTKQSAKNRWRILAYIVNIIKCLAPKRFKAACRKMHVKAGDVEFEGEFIFGTISNSRSIGTLHLLVDKHVVLDDGLLEASFIPRPRRIKGWIRLYKSLKKDDFNEAQSLRFVRAPEITLTMEPTTFTLDGEDGGEHESITIAAANKVLKIALPERILTKRERKKARRARKKAEKRARKAKLKEEKRAEKAQKKVEKKAQKAQKKQKKQEKKGS